DAIKQVIDVVSDDIESLAEAGDYEIIRDNLRSDALLEMIVDVAPYFRTPGALGFDPNLTFDLAGNARLGIAFSAETTGFSMEMFTPNREEGEEFKNDYKGEILDILPNDVAGYYGSTDLSNFMNEYLVEMLSIPKLQEKNVNALTLQEEFNISLEEDIMSWMRGEYTFVYLDRKKDDTALIFKVDNPKQVAEKLKKIEPAISRIATALSKEAGSNFSFQQSDTSPLGPIRYMPIEGTSNYFLNYGFRDKLLIMATSRDAIDTLFDDKLDGPALPNSRKYKLVFENVNVEETAGSAYVDGKLFVEFMELLGLDLVFFERHIVGLGLETQRLERGTKVVGAIPLI
ncbi:DUF3352 domain-containing protein, partial [Patescibacteria group bacterium]